MRALIVVLWLSAALADESVPSAPPCKSIADCWLDDGGKAIARPKKFRGKRVPRGDCGMHLLWLQNHLACDEGRCVATHIGDRC
jgi:hypothetical protein